MVVGSNPLRAVLHRIGFALRESGQALERVGCRLQGIYSFEEPLNEHTPVSAVGYHVPSVQKNSFVASSGLVCGDVKLGANCSVWYGASLRGDHQRITVGENSNIQDGAFVGALSEFSPPCTIGKNVSIGHGAVLKGCTIGDNVLVGINAVISEHVTVGPLSVVAAGAYVEEGTTIPSGEVWAGNPASKMRQLRPEEEAYLKQLPSKYVNMGAEHNEMDSLIRHKQAEYYS